MPNQDKRPVIAVTMGDPAGIGPEITLKMAAGQRDFLSRIRPVVIGDRRILAQTAASIGVNANIQVITTPGESRGLPGTLELIDLQNADPDQIEAGKVSARAGAAAVEYIQYATRLALEDQVAAIVTGPINKDSINQAGYHYAGHTELLTELTGASDVSMMLVSSKLRVLHVSTHVSLRLACDRVQKDRVLKVIRLAHQAVRQLGFAAPRVAVAGLNPHASEGGLFGYEETREIIPAIKQARAEGIDATGPWPGDTVFMQAVRGKFDVVVAMYHDQGHIPMKLLGFEEGVNVSIGLPIIRTSVDHGTGFDIVGQGVASESSLIAAVEVAAQMIAAKETIR